MSETVHYTGKLTRVSQHLGNGVEEQAYNILSNSKSGTCIRDTWNETWVEQLLDEDCGDYIVHDGNLYSIDRKENNADEDIFDADKNEDGSISFTVRYYNGGCSFDEAIKIALKNLVFYQLFHINK